MKMSLSLTRRNTGLTQKQVAENMGVTASTVSNWENSVTSLKISQFARLCNLYNCSVDDIFL